MRTLSRRSLLRGAGGVALALPLLESMLPHRARAAAATVPKRYVICFGGFSLTNDAAPMGAQGFIRARSVGLEFEGGADAARRLPRRGQQPGEAAGERRERADHSRRASFRGGRAGARDGFHWHCNPLLTGTRQVATTDSKVTAPSSDQLVAAAVGSATRFPSLSYRVQASQYINGAKAETQLDREHTLVR